MYTFITISFKIYRKSDNDIVMECSPAYATTEFKTKLVTLLTITLCLYTDTVLLMILMKDSPAYSTVQQTQSVI